MKQAILSVLLCSITLIATGCAKNYTLLSSVPNPLRQSIRQSIRQLEFNPKLPSQIPFSIGSGVCGITTVPQNKKQQTLFISMVDKQKKHMIEIQESNFPNQKNFEDIKIISTTELSNGSRADVARLSTGAEFLQWKYQGIIYRLISGTNNGSNPPIFYGPDLNEQQLVKIANTFTSN